MKPTYYVQHPDGTYSVADPQPGGGKELHDKMMAAVRKIVSASKEPARWGSVGPDAEELAWGEFSELLNHICIGIDSAPAQPKPMTRKELVMHMATRFMGWPLPKHFSPDCGISFSPIAGSHPIGTNLLHMIQALEMFEYVLEGTPLAKE